MAGARRLKEVLEKAEVELTLEKKNNGRLKRRLPRLKRKPKVKLSR